MRPFSPFSPFIYAAKSSSRPQQGIALFIVIIFVMLSMLLALWASRTAIFNEMVVGNDADYQRAFEAAQSLIRDAELDIEFSFSKKDHRSDKIKLPLESSEINNILNELNETPFCKHGLCVKHRGKQDFWNNLRPQGADNPAADNFEVFLDQLTADGVGARYGQFTDAKYKDGSDNDAPKNAILAERSPTQGGWYWIEVLKYANPGDGSSLIVNDSSTTVDLKLKPSVVYRITALAYGLKANNMAVIQQTYAPTRLQD